MGQGKLIVDICLGLREGKTAYLLAKNYRFSCPFGFDEQFQFFFLMPHPPTVDSLDEKRIPGLHLSVWLQAHWIFNFKSYSIFWSLHRVYFLYSKVATSLQVN